jgi:polar amino acid transport system substrate-binding protein
MMPVTIRTQLRLSKSNFVSKGLMSLFGLYFSCSTPLLAQNKTVFQEIQRTGLLKVAVREDAVPFGYRDLNNNWTGICLDFMALLKQEVIRKLDRPTILVKLFKSTLFNRFDLVDDGVVYLECGPNSIRANLDYKNVTFSEPFLLTGTQLLIREADKSRINPNSSLPGITIGVLRNTTNFQFIREKYPEATIQEFQGVTGRLRGVQALRQEKIDAFASDGILLLGEALLQNLALGTDYLMIPKIPLNCEAYGLILPNHDPEWKALVDETIKNYAARQLYQKWIGPVLPEIESAIKYCEQQKTTPLENNQINDQLE